MSIPPINKKDKGSEPSKVDVSIPTKIGKIAKMLREETKRLVPKKRSGIVLSAKEPAVGSVNTIEQVAKLLRSQASKVHNIIKKRYSKN
ncbi:MAG TPA: hypothetical protein VLG49_00930 [Rhabdochlamydiaceae bacterium]|nr:hypothetical protein [Rhabdochlamydiaceae bacterium]